MAERRAGAGVVRLQAEQLTRAQIGQLGELSMADVNRLRAMATNRDEQWWTRTERPDASTEALAAAE